MGIKSVKLGYNVSIVNPVNLYGCVLGDNVKIGPFVEIQKNVTVGKRTKISSHSFLCEGVTLGNDCFIAHGVMFINDIFSDSENVSDWKLRKTTIGNNVRIGSNAPILPVSIGDNAIIGAGSVVTGDVIANTTVCGNPARELQKV